MESASERALIKAAQDGSEPAVEELFRRHWPDAHRAAYLIVRDAAAAEDIAQEAFLAALSALGRFDRRRPFRPWLHRIAVNRAIDWSRARAVRSEVAASPALLDAVGSEPPLRRGPGRPRTRSSAALGALPPEQRAVVVLRYLLEYTPGEIARLLDLPRGTINSRLRRGLDRLSELPRWGGAMNEERLRQALREVGCPTAEGAEERALALVRAAAPAIAGEPMRARPRHSAAAGFRSPRRSPWSPPWSAPPARRSRALRPRRGRGRAPPRRGRR